MTHRQYLGWLSWLEDEWNNPSRADHYAMQAAAETRRQFRKNPAQVKLEDLKIPFRFSKPKPVLREDGEREVIPLVTKEHIIAINKAAAIAKVKGRPKRHGN